VLDIVGLFLIEFDSPSFNMSWTHAQMSLCCHRCPCNISVTWPLLESSSTLASDFSSISFPLFQSILKLVRQRIHGSRDVCVGKLSFVCSYLPILPAHALIHESAHPLALLSS
jgi:hypothetical protein